MMKKDRRTFLAGLKSLLGYHEVLGLGPYPLNRDVQSFLDVTPTPAKEAQTAAAAPARNVVRNQSHPGLKVPAGQPSAVTLAEIAEEVISCRACDLHKQRMYPVVGRGPEKVRLLIAGDWLSGDEQGRLPPGHLFGVEQDRMLARMLAAINLPVAEVFITNVIKCAVPATCQPQAGHVQSCVSYLRRQIAALAPELICTMGMVAARVIVEKSLPLSRLRGRFHDYEVTPGVRIPVLTTYHPSYLLQNPEMKAATWTDLQLLAKQLGLNTV
jgi:DNA polymerase